MESAARSVLQDWNSGKIPYYTLPPQEESNVYVEAAVVASWAKEFKIDEILEQEAKMLEQVDDGTQGCYVRMVC